MDDFTLILPFFGRRSFGAFFIPKFRFLVLSLLFCLSLTSCFPDMVRKKKTENDWFKIAAVSYVSEGKKLRITLKGFVKNPDLESIYVYESEEELADRLVLRKENGIIEGDFFIKSDPLTGGFSDWIRKIGTSRKWIRIDLKNRNGMEIGLLTEVQISETEKKVLRKDLSIEAEGEIIRLDGREWKIVSEVNSSEQALLQYIPKTEFVLFWTEMVSIHVYKLKSSSPDQIYSLLENTKRKDCPSVVWRKEPESNSKITYFWEHSGCGKQSAMSEIAKLYKGEYGIYNIRYDRKGKITDVDKDHWSSLLEKLPTK